jgi:hypothetical protein
MARIRNMLGGLTCGAGVAAVLIAIMGTVSAHGTQAVSAVAASGSAAANQAAAGPQAPLGSEALPGTSTTREPSLILRIDRVLGVKLKISPRHQQKQESVRLRAQPASSYKFEDLAITRQVAADGKPNSGFVSYFRLNRALPFAPRGSSKGKKKAARVCSRRISR